MKVKCLNPITNRGERMKRRDFLRYGIGISLASSSLYSLANMMNHAQHGNMAMMHSAPTGLMPTEAMPSGLSLNGILPKLANQSTQACLLYTSPSPRDGLLSRMPSSA